ncbi:MAG: polyribonucleotide nucleotidyltransferase [Synergistetes bacterium]|nr:polyribonucleotide nucleotidyltransferase [Synergistota bacterium]
MIEVVGGEVGGRELSFEIGRVAWQANGATLVRYGGTVVLVTAVMSDEVKEGVDFLPLLVDYEERFYAAGKIPGGFFKREGKPSEKAILSARLVDRSIRPLFPKGFRNDVHVVVTVLSYDQLNQPELLAINGASLALGISEIPFEGPIAAVRVGYIDGEFVVNPTEPELETSDLDLVIAGTKDAIVMVESGSQELPEKVIINAMEFGHEHIKKIIEIQERLIEKCGKEKVKVELPPRNEELARKIRERWAHPIREALNVMAKAERNAAIAKIQQEAFKELGEEFLGYELQIKEELDALLHETVRKMIVEEGIRADGRGWKDIRPITCEVGLLPRTHGSALFTRGETQALVITTIGVVGDEQIVDGLGEEEAKRFMLHYNFPPYSVGEVRPLRGPGRREIGHGALAERALKAVIPSEDEFPYIIRVVSEVLSSNGSTSMATVCGGTLSLMDAGVPIKSPVAGIAMGLVKENDKVVVLSDILGLEDHHGDMDFKVAGTERGITALQMDLKIKGITFGTLEQALEQAKEGRLYILEKMREVIAEPRPTLSPYAPRIMVAEIDPDRIHEVIGPGGKIIRDIIRKTGAKIDIEEDGKVYISSPTEESGIKALEMIKDIAREVKEGDVFKGKVTRITKFGAFVEIWPGKMGLVHISELSDKKVKSVEEVVKVGDEIEVMVIGIDSLGRIALSRRKVLEATEGTSQSSVEPKFPKANIRKPQEFRRK